MEDVLIFSVGGLTGLKEAIQASYPNAEIQRCIIHQLRNSFKYVSYKDLREFANDFKEVYKAVNEEEGYQKLLDLASQNAMKKWNQRYRNCDSILNQLMIFFEGRVEQYL